VYALAFMLPEDVRFRAGALGRVELDAGRYVYVGSAQRGLRQRVERHFRRRKKTHWHIDYLTLRREPELAVAWELERAGECRLARVLLQRWPAAWVGFGSSDCRCPAHLVGPVGEDWLEYLVGAAGPPVALVYADEFER